MAIDIDTIIAAVQAAQLLKDKDTKAAPQSFDPLLSKFVPLLSDNGAARQVLYGPDGQPLSIVDNKLAVRAEEVETLLTALKGKDFATETTLAQILAKMIASPATEAKQAEILAALGKQSTAEKQDILADLIGAIDAAAVSDPAAAGAVIALLKGVLSRLQAVEGKIDGITDGTTPAKTELTGSNVGESQAIPVRQKMLTEERLEDFTVTAGATFAFYDNPDEGEVAKVTVVIVSYIAHTYTLNVLNTSILGSNPSTVSEKSTSTIAHIKNYELCTKRLRMSIKNEDTADQTYKASISRIFR